MKPGGIGRFKPPAPVYRPCVLCGRKHRVRPDGTSKTAYVPSLTEVSVVQISPTSAYFRVPPGALICLRCGSKARR